MKITAAIACLATLPAVMQGFSVIEDNDFENGKWDTTARDLQSTAYVQAIFPSGISPTFSPAFLNAAGFWNGVLSTPPVSPIVFTSAFSVAANVPGCDVSFTFPAGSRIQGLSIFAFVNAIDGVNGILGQAFPCAFTSTSTRTFPRLGNMLFDSADAAGLVADGSFPDVVRHEMGHVIGIGSLWATYGLVTTPCTRVPCNTNPRYNGANGRAGLGALGGGTGLIPAANEGGGGTANVHWREATFRNELMTGFLDSNVVNPISIMTVRSLQDLGYSVNTAAAQSYSLPRPGDSIKHDHEMINDLKEFEFVDLDAAVTTNESKNKFSKLTLLVAVAAGVVSAFSVMLVFALYKFRQSRVQAEAAPVVNAPMMGLSTKNPMSELNDAEAQAEA